MASGRLLVALCLVAALFAARSEAHGLGDFTGGSTQATPQMESFFGAKPEAAELPQVLDASMPAKPVAAAAIPTTTTAATSATSAATTASSSSSGTPRRSVSVAAGVACGVAAVAVVGVAAAVAYVVRARRGGARREAGAVQLGAAP